MHVVHVTNDFQDNGTGITNLVRTLAVAQRAAGHDVTVASEVGTSAYHVELAALGVRFVRFDRVTNPLGARRLARVLGRERPDAVHVHTARTALAVLAAAPSLRRRSVATVHNVFQRASALMAGCALVVCISGSAQERFQRMVPWAARRVRVIYNAVELERTAPAPGRGCPLLPPRSVAHVGGLHHRKGVDVLVRAVGRLADAGDPVQLFIYGNRDQPWLEEQATHLVAAGRVHFEGFTRDPRSVMRAAGVLAVPSRDEPFGLVALEARAAGAAVVASDVGGLPEVLDGGRAGVLVPPEDVGAWADALRSVLDDDALRADLVRRGGEGLERFSPEAMAAAYTEVYRSLR